MRILIAARTSRGATGGSYALPNGGGWETPTFIASLPGGAHAVFDSGDPPDAFRSEMRGRFAKLAACLAELGDGWITFLDSEELRAKLVRLGFGRIEASGNRPAAFPLLGPRNRRRRTAAISGRRPPSGCESSPLSPDGVAAPRRRADCGVR
jgi:hypothetical protein